MKIMTDQATRILEEALRLPPEARAAIAGRLMESLDEQVDEDAEAAWAREIARRLQEVDSGNVAAIPWPEARRRILGEGNGPDDR
jgi:putative addiction module component (TIGR02574 family)